MPGVSYLQVGASPPTSRTSTRSGHEVVISIVHPQAEAGSDVRREERYAAATSRALKVCKQPAFRTRSGTRQSGSTSVSGHIGGQPTGHKSLSSTNLRRRRSAQHLNCRSIIDRRAHSRQSLSRYRLDTAGNRIRSTRLAAGRAGTAVPRDSVFDP